MPWIILIVVLLIIAAGVAAGVAGSNSIQNSGGVMGGDRGNPDGGIPGIDEEGLSGDPDARGGRPGGVTRGDGDNGNRANRNRR